VHEGIGTRAKVEGTRRTDAVDEGLMEIGVLAIENTDVVDIKVGRGAEPRLRKGLNTGDGHGLKEEEEFF
jgi:hypothetical protein